MRHRRALFAITCAATLASASVASATTGTRYIRVATTAGHATTPVWYHDTVASAVGADAAVGWTTDAGAVQARRLDLRAGVWTAPAVRVSVTHLDCGCVDSTGTNPNRHDVPTLVTDRAGRVYAFYGGGTAAQTGNRTGPYFRAAAEPASIASWLPEQRLTVPGAVYDMQAVRDATGAVDVVGQQGHSNVGAGSLILLRLPSGTATTPGSVSTFGSTYRTLISGGEKPTACAWRFAPGCNIFVEANLVAGPQAPGTTKQRLFLVWNWAEASLSDDCGDPSGFCNHGLYAAYSDDHGRTWRSLRHTAPHDVTTDPIGYDDPAFALVRASTDVGLFKAVAVTGGYPGRPVIAYEPGADVGHGQLRIGSWTGTGLTTVTLDRSRPWNNHPVLWAGPRNTLELWSDVAQTGNHAPDLAQWLRDSSGRWHKSLIAVGDNWYLTGTTMHGHEVLVWRAPAAAGRTKVVTAVLPVPAG